VIGVIVFAHGSRDPQWRLPVEAVAERIRSRSPGTPVACAYLELTEPDLPTAADSLFAAGVTDLHILPLFFGMGKHAREDLPLLVTQLQQQHPERVVRALPAAGEHAEVTDLLARIALNG